MSVPSKHEWVRTERAKLDGIEEGQRKARVRTVKTLRDIVSDATPSDSALASFSLEELAVIVVGFQRQLRGRIW